MKKTVSVIIPCYNESCNIDSLYAALAKLAAAEGGYSWQLLFIDDGSTDGTLDKIRQLRAADARVCYVSLSRNFGKENALMAGFDNATGDCAAIIDADMQHPPMLISGMLRLWEQGYDDIYAEREDRGKESLARRYLSMAYYKLLQKMAKTDVLPNVGDFRLLDRKCIEAIRNLRETQRYTKGLYCWVGFRKKSIKFRQGDRVAGKSSFNYSKLFNLAIEGITSYSTAPLRISTLTGVVISIFAFIYMCYILIKTVTVGEPVQGFPTLITVILFLGGIQLVTIGILGEYIGRIFYETKRRPPYIVKEMEGETTQPEQAATATTGVKKHSHEDK